jgi:hypothetical protein
MNRHHTMDVLRFHHLPRYAKGPLRSLQPSLASSPLVRRWSSGGTRLGASPSSLSEARSMPPVWLPPHVWLYRGGGGVNRVVA